MDDEMQNQLSASSSTEEGSDQEASSTGSSRPADVAAGNSSTETTSQLDTVSSRSTRIQNPGQFANPQQQNNRIIHERLGTLTPRTEATSGDGNFNLRVGSTSRGVANTPPPYASTVPPPVGSSRLNPIQIPDLETQQANRQYGHVTQNAAEVPWWQGGVRPNVPTPRGPSAPLLPWWEGVQPTGRGTPAVHINGPLFQPPGYFHHQGMLHQVPMFHGVQVHQPGYNHRPWMLPTFHGLQYPSGYNHRPWMLPTRFHGLQYPPGYLHHQGIVPTMFHGVQVQPGYDLRHPWMLQPTISVYHNHRQGMQPEVPAHFRGQAQHGRPSVSSAVDQAIRPAATSNSELMGRRAPHKNPSMSTAHMGGQTAAEPSFIPSTRDDEAVVMRRSGNICHLCQREVLSPDEGQVINLAALDPAVALLDFEEHVHADCLNQRNNP